MIYSLIFILLLSSVCFGQKCDLTLKDSPTIRGVKLFMTNQELEKQYPSFRLQGGTNSFQAKQLEVIPELSNLSKLNLDLFSRRNDETKILWRFSLQYNQNVVEWDSVKEFADNLSLNLKLPFNTWVYSGDTANMQCREFKIEISKANEITLYFSKVEQSNTEIKETKKKGFKP